MVTIAVRASCPGQGRCSLPKSPEPVQQSGLDPATSRMLDALLGDDSLPAAAAGDAIRRLLVLLEVADTVTRRLSLDHQLPRLIELIVEVLDADRATLFLHDADAEELFSRVESTTTNGDREATLHLKRPQPALLALVASGDTPVYPCHISPRDMRQHPIGTGPFKFVEYKQNQRIKLARNADYWKPGRPYLDGVEYTIIPNRSTAILGFIAGKFDMTFPYEVTIPLLKDIKTQLPNAPAKSAWPASRSAYWSTGR